MTLCYTPGQLRSAVAIPPETYRHWKKALAPLRRDKGHSPCFTSGDLVAVAVVRTLSIDFAIRIGALTALAETLFAICNSVPWPTLERSKALIDLPNGLIRFLPEGADILSGGPILLVPLRPIVAHLRDQLFAPGQSDAQETLRFPPTALPSLPDWHPDGANRERG